MAVREALLNVLVHREYSFRASTFISFYTDRIEFTSIGGLVSGVTLKDVMMGISVCRNVKLANIFYRLELIEAYGTGILKIMEAYAGTGKDPQIETSDNVFKIILLKERGTFTRKDVEKMLGFSQTTCGRLLNRVNSIIKDSKNPTIQ